MKVFISWSGTSSRLVAEALSDWLQRVIQAVKPFYSPDIDKGAKWSNEIDNALEGTRFGIICLTPDNLNSSWIHYEAGALSKTKDASIWTFLLELKPSDVKQPLGRFQHTLAEKTDVLKMLKSINAKLVEVGGESLRENLLEEIFEESWSKLEARLNQAKESIVIESKSKAIISTKNTRSETDKLDEILEILRVQQRLSNKEKPITRSKSERKPTIRFFVEGIGDLKERSKLAGLIADFYTNTGTLVSVFEPLNGKSLVEITVNSSDVDSKEFSYTFEKLKNALFQLKLHFENLHSVDKYGNTIPYSVDKYGNIIPLSV